MPVWISDWSHVNKIAPVWVYTVLMKSGFYCPWVSEDVVKHSWELLNFSLRGCLHDTSSLYAFHSATSSPQFPLASLYLLYDYNTKSRNSASHTWVSSYRYHVNMVQLFDSFCIKLINHIATQINLTSPWKKDFVTWGREILNYRSRIVAKGFLWMVFCHTLFSAFPAAILVK